MRVVAILETMWGAELAGETAPRCFTINRNNHSGKRLYALIGPDSSLLVTNACREYVISAKGHGNPDPEWLLQNLKLLDGERDGRIDVLLVCGKVAQATYARCNFMAKRARVIHIPHPAARFIWNKTFTDDIRTTIAKAGSP